MFFFLYDIFFLFFCSENVFKLLVENSFNILNSVDRLNFKQNNLYQIGFVSFRFFQMNTILYITLLSFQWGEKWLKLEKQFKKNTTIFSTLLIEWG